MANKTHVEICFEVAKLYVLSHLDSMHPDITVKQIHAAINKVGNALNDLPALFTQEGDSSNDSTNSATDAARKGLQCDT